MLSLYRSAGQQIDFYKRPQLDKIFTMKVDEINEKCVVITTQDLVTGEEKTLTLHKGSFEKLHESVQVTIKQLLKNTVIFNFIVDDDIKVLRSELKLFKQ